MSYQFAIVLWFPCGRDVFGTLHSILLGTGYFSQERSFPLKMCLAGWVVLAGCCQAVIASWYSGQFVVACCCWNAFVWEIIGTCVVVSLNGKIRKVLLFPVISWSLNLLEKLTSLIHLSYSWGTVLKGHSLICLECMAKVNHGCIGLKIQLLSVWYQLWGWHTMLAFPEKKNK